jgi:Reverse transcriptase (RNA-dependent DNA polymerase)/gag-polypeptide of LTR copia-type/Integrase core domain/GAG-pre-integrase domain
MDQGGSFGGFKIDKLTSSNYHTWKQKIELVLAFRELDEVVFNIVSTNVMQDTAAAAELKKKDAKAKAVIGLTLSDEHLEHVRGAETAAEMWLAIKNVFQRTSLLNKLAARRRFYTASMVDNEKILTYINRVKQLTEELKAMGVIIDDEEVAMAVLNGLPPKYDHLIVALDTMGDDTKLTLEFTKSRLMQEEQRSDEREMRNTSRVKTEDAALVGNSSHKTVGHIRDRSNNMCFRCNKPGHVARYCRSKVYFDNENSGYRNTKVGDTAQVVKEDRNSGDESDSVCLIGKNIGDSKICEMKWLIDSGASVHMTSCKDAMEEYKSIPIPNISIGDKTKLQIVGSGNVTIAIMVDERVVKCTIRNVLHVPSLGYNLLSVGAMEAKGMTASFGGGICSIFACSKKVAQGTRVGNIYMLDAAADTSISCTATISMETWHARLGHSNFRGIANMISTNTITGIDPKVCKSNLSQCEACIYGKSHRIPFEHPKANRASGLLDLVHSDVCGPMQVPSMGGSRYFVTFTDDHSKWSDVFCMKMKSEVLECFRIWQKLAECHTGCKIRTIRSDDGGEYLSRAFKDHLTEHGITHQLTVPYTPQQNGIAERLNRTLLNSTRSMLKHMNCDKIFWAEAVTTACYIKNRVTTTGLPNNTTPHEIWIGKKPDVGHLRVFGSKCWYTIPKENIKNLDDRTSEAIMIGYPKHTKGYKLWDVNTQNVVISRDVLFEEVKYSTEFCQLEDKMDHNIHEDTPSTKSIDSKKIDDIENDNDPELDDVPVISSKDAAESMEPSVDNIPGVRRSTRIRNAPGPWWANTAFIATNTEPKTFRQAITGDDAAHWKSAMSAEYHSLMKHNTWNLVPRPQNRNIVSCKWIFKTKQVETDSGEIEVKYKARLVAKGYSQVHGVDYEETYAPVVKFTSVRILLAIVALLDLELHQMDVVTAFLNGDLNEEIFMEQPEGFGAEDSSKVCKLAKSLYGLKQAPRQWHAKIDGFLVEVLGFSRNMSDECVYVQIQGGIIAIIALYVDDWLIACNKIGILNEIKEGLSREFEMKDMGQARMCLGFRISRTRSERKLTMSQEKYASAVLSRFGMSDANGAPTPMEVSIDVDDSSELATTVP